MKRYIILTLCAVFSFIATVALMLGIFSAKFLVVAVPCCIIAYHLAAYAEKLQYANHVVKW